MNSLMGRGLSPVTYEFMNLNKFLCIADSDFERTGRY